VGKHEGKRHFGPLNINGNIILKTILKKLETYRIRMSQDGDKRRDVVTVQLAVTATQPTDKRLLPSHMQMYEPITSDL
jgi:hypothetical protein